MASAARRFQRSPRAQLTGRTFYRYFADKREVLFWRAGELQARVANAVAGAPAHVRPLAVAIRALEAVGDFFDGSRANVKLGQALVAAHPEFLEREMLKLHELMSAMGRRPSRIVALKRPSLEWCLKVASRSRESLWSGGSVTNESATWSTTSKVQEMNFT